MANCFMRSSLAMVGQSMGAAFVLSPITKLPEDWLETAPTTEAGPLNLMLLGHPPCMLSLWFEWNGPLIDSAQPYMELADQLLIATANLDHDSWVISIRRAATAPRWSRITER